MDEETDPYVNSAKVDFDEAVRKFVSEMDKSGAYMPGLATYLRIHADELAERFPDDTNGGFTV